MKWDIDKELTAYEPKSIPGTSISRVMLDYALFAQYGLKLPKDQTRESGMIWCLGLGQIHLRKKFFYGRTIREAFLKAKKNDGL